MMLAGFARSQTWSRLCAVRWQRCALSLLLST